MGMTKQSECSACLSSRIVSASFEVKTARYSMSSAPNIERNYEGPPLQDMGITDTGPSMGSFLWFEYCLDCGCIQGKFPLPETELERQPLEDLAQPDCSAGGWSVWR